MPSFIGENMYGIYDGSKVIARLVAPISLVSNVPCFMKDSISLKRDIGSRAAQRWELTSNLEPLSVDANDLFVELVSRGPTSPFKIMIPQNIGVIRKRASDVGACHASGALNSNQLTISTSGFLPKGTLLKVSGHNKLYMTLTDRDGSGVVNVYPQLRASFANNILYWQDDVLLEMYADTDMIRGMSFTDGILMDNGAIKFVEAL